MSWPKLLHTHSTLLDRSYLMPRRPRNDAYRRPVWSKCSLWLWTNSPLTWKRIDANSSKIGEFFEELPTRAAELLRFRRVLTWQRPC
jgi:hypothetical protein